MHGNKTFFPLFLQLSESLFSTGGSPENAANESDFQMSCTIFSFFVSRKKRRKWPVKKSDSKGIIAGAKKCFQTWKTRTMFDASHVISGTLCCYVHELWEKRENTASIISPHLTFRSRGSTPSGDQTAWITCAWMIYNCDCHYNTGKVSALCCISLSVSYPERESLTVSMKRGDRKLHRAKHMKLEWLVATTYKAIQRRRKMM